MGRFCASHLNLDCCLFFLLISFFLCVMSAIAINGASDTVFSQVDQDFDEVYRRILLANGLGRTPPMGWNSWNHFNCKIDEKIIKETADALVSTGLAKLGYQYVNLDDCWAAWDRDSKGNLVGNKSTFPSGIKNLADYVHNKGLKLGIYADSGHRTCSGKMPGSLGREEQDANTFASWGIDYLKYDNCFNDDTRPTIRYLIMSRALMKTGRPIFFSMCEWGDMHPALWGATVGNSWRTTDDISNSWGRFTKPFSLEEVDLKVGESAHLKVKTVDISADLNEVYADYAKPGGWNDPDMLEVGNGGMKFSEYVVHFSIWAVSKAPLLLGCDIRSVTKETMTIISNTEVIAVNQDRLGIQAKKVRMEGLREIWAGRLSRHRIVVLFVNRSPWDAPMTAHWDDIGINPNTSVRARDLWKHQTLEMQFKDKLTVTVVSHACVMYVLAPVSPKVL